MTKNFHLRIPTISNYNVRYYISNAGITLPAKVYPMHLHDNIEIYVLLEGDVSFVVESSYYKLSPGDVIISKPNERHNCILNTESKHRHLCFWFDPSCEFLFEDFIKHDFGKNNLIVPDEDSKKRLSQLYAELDAASRENDTHKQLYLTLEMLCILRKCMSLSSLSQPLPDELKEILSDIDDNFQTIRSLDYFHQKYYMSASTLNRLFRTYLHTTPKTYLETKKLAYSRFLLKSGKSVLDSSMEAGFSDYSNFIRIFKKRFHITPKQYKGKKGDSEIDNGYKD